MPVYVDDMRAKYRGMIMCHCIGTSEQELFEMMDKIGVARKWYQGDHFDICLSKREKAVKLGAIPITRYQLGSMVMHWRRTGKWLKPEQAEKAVRKFLKEQSNGKAEGSSTRTR